MTVFVLDSRKKPLMPCSEKRARLLLERGRARVHRMVPFAIRLLDRLQAESVLQPVRLKADPGSKTTGLALVREKETVHPETGEVVLTAVVLMLLELQHRVDTTDSLVNRLMRLAPITALSQELVRFDMQQMQNPEISGAEYQQGTLAGYEIREYLLEKWGRECVYCDAENTPLEIDHIHPRSRGGSDRVSNLAIACHDCNQRKGNMPLEQFLAKAPERAEKILKQAKARLNDAAAVNSTRWALFQRLKATGLDVEVASGGRTKWNRIRLGLPKAHCIDAACVGYVDAINQWQQPVLGIKATGRGSYQRTRLTKHGFPRGYLTRSKSAFGFQTGDMVHAVVPTRAGRKPGKKAGAYLGRVAIRASGNFNIQTGNGLVQGIHHRFCTLIQRADGYGYSWTKIATTQGDAGMGQASPAALSLPGLNPGVSRATG
ncbi:HNH endonuclease domain protein [Acidithiobacillus ferrivorans]|uniref:HNH endonuclease domain protein n=1 Tax=Acidithiobacillus ferrivorans TaxID=160808 RepID=A0A060V097_9PROT|nr:RNA-guided endonuclease IscB [Acidithiobacillus ferrivorans]CDQ12099.1 HNH endonuclease domain protein [Acidithiobacillus ferrivorans]SMH64774.1 HNH endonuclease domain protein [Acidithiobacillus ferrivorans]